MGIEPFRVGGSGGIGSEICRLLTERGSNVAFTFHENTEKAEELKSEILNQGSLCISRSEWWGLIRLAELITI